MNTTLLPPSDDDLHKTARNLDPRKQKSIKPLGRAATSIDTSIPGASDDLLEELRRKTAALAAEIDTQKKSHKTASKVESDLRLDLPVTKEEQQPLEDDSQSGAHYATSIVRGKLQRIYSEEPDAKHEISTIQHSGQHLSKHQQYMQKLTNSDASIVEVQTKWHTYYVNLPEDEKHEVWREFYLNQRNASKHNHNTHSHPKSKLKPHNSPPKPRVYQAQHRPFTPHSIDPRASGDVRKLILNRINAGGNLTVKHHIKSLLFGISMSTLVLLITSFVFFNEAFVAPFISPGRTVSATPIIGTQSSEVGPEPKIIIPKINLEVPIVYDLQTVEEVTIQNALEDGVVHYANTPKSGETGNSVIVGHSSNNIFNKGKYKFAFVLLKRLEAEDTFFVHRDGVRYTYKVYKKEIVSPDAVSVLNTQDRSNTITLITCDPPGTSINRLIIVAEQISPDPTGNVASTAKIETASTDALPSNAPSLWSRIWPF